MVGPLRHNAFAATPRPPHRRAQGSALVIDVGYAKISGFQNTTSGLNQYHGIRYAHNPTGLLRWHHEF